MIYILQFVYEKVETLLETTVQEITNKHINSPKK